MKAANDSNWRRRINRWCSYRLLWWSIVSIIYFAAAVVILVTFKEFGLPLLGDFRAKAIVLIVVNIFLYALIGAGAIYFLRAYRKKAEDSIEKLQKCGFCERALESSEASHSVKDHVVCPECFAKIEQERQESQDQNVPRT